MQKLNDKCDNKKRCLNCPVGHQFISGYFMFYSKYLLYSNENLKEEDLPEFKRSVDKLSDVLNLEGEFEERVEFLGSIASKNMKAIPNTQGEISECIKTLHEIILPIKILFERNFSYLERADISRLYFKGGASIISEINAVNAKNDIVPVTGMKNKLENCCKVVKKLKDEDFENIKKLYFFFYNILKKYTEISPNDFRYKYSNWAYNQNNTIRDCGSDNFLKAVELLPKPLDVARISRLKQEYQDVIYDYISKAPKHFGNLLSKVIELQGLSDTDIIMLLWGEKIEPSNESEQAILQKPNKSPNSIKSLRDSEQPELSQEELKKLSRILLVSEDVLQGGTGKIYGNWNSVLKTEKSEDKKTLQNYYKNELNILKTRDIKEAVRVQIFDMINQNDSEFEKMINDNDFFSEEDLCLYTCEYEEEEGVYIDYDVMYQQLLHPDELDTLISVLEKLQTTE